jgi:hypothetical protein
MTSQNPFGPTFWLLIAALSAAALGCFGYAGLQLPAETPAVEMPTRSPVSFIRTESEHASL